MAGGSGRLRVALGSSRWRKRVRYAAVSAVFVPAGFVLLQVLGLLLDDYTRASLLSAAILTPPNFLANRYLVWQIRTRDNLRTQILVFWVGAMLGVTLATSFVFLTERSLAGRSTVVRGTGALVAQLTGFGLVWVGRYLLLDRWLFKVTHHGVEPDPQLVEELHRDLPV